MRLLLFFISILFSFIFYVFYLFSIGKDILGKTLDITYAINSISTNLLYETVLFIIIACSFYIYFMDFSGRKKIKEKKELFKIGKRFFVSSVIILITIIIFILMYLLLIQFINNKFLLINLLGLFFNIFLFFFLLNVSCFGKYKKIIKILSILFLYLSSIFGIYFLLNNNINYIVLLILSYSILFNLKIHYYYNNYISLFFGLITFFFLIFFLFFV